MSLWNRLWKKKSSEISEDAESNEDITVNDPLTTMVPLKKKPATTPKQNVISQMAPHQLSVSNFSFTSSSTISYGSYDDFLKTTKLKGPSEDKKPVRTLKPKTESKTAPVSISDVFFDNDSQRIVNNDIGNIYNANIPNVHVAETKQKNVKATLPNPRQPYPAISNHDEIAGRLRFQASTSDVGVAKVTSPSSGPNPAIWDLNSDYLQLHEQGKIGMTSLWIGAEHALQHIQKNQSQVEAAFATHYIEKSEYVLYAGFDESLIQAGVGYLEQIHVFSSRNITGESPLLSQLGRIFSPFSSILFTESSVYELPVYKADGTTWIFGELAFQTASKFIDRGSTAALNPVVISLSKTSGEINASGGSPPNDSGSNDGEKKEENSKGKGKEKDDRGKEENDDNDEADENPDDPDVPVGKPNDTTEPPTVLFDVVTEIFGTEDGTEKQFQILTVNGKIMIQVDPPKSKCDVKFVKLKFGTTRATNIGYEQIHLRVIIDPQEQDADAEAIQPLQTSASDGEVKGVSGSKSSWGQNSSLATSLRLVPQATLMVGSSRTSETSGTLEKKQYTSPIVDQVLYGVVRWGFQIDDESDRKEGVKLLGSKLPEASFEFRPKSVPSSIDVELSSYWSLIPSDKQALGWITNIVSRSRKNSVVYSNICQAVSLKILSNLTKRSEYKATLRVDIANPDLDLNINVREKGDGQIGVTHDMSGADHYTPVQHEKWDNSSLLTLPTLQHLRTKFIRKTDN